VSTVHARLDYAGNHPLWLLLWQEAARAARSLGDDHRLSRALRLVATAHRHSGRVQQALDPAAEAAALVPRLTDLRERVQALSTYGETLRDLNRLEAARQTLGDALTLADQLGDTLTELRVRSALATVHMQDWKPELAVPVLERAVAIAPRTDTREAAWALLGLSGAYRLTGRGADGAALAHRAVAMARAVDDDFALGYALAELMVLAGQAGLPDDARSHLRESIGVFRRIGHGTGIGIVNQRFGSLEDDAGRHRQALRHFDAAITQFEELADAARTAIARLYRAASLAGAGQHTAAHAEWSAAEHDSALPESPEVVALRQRLQQRLGVAGPVAPRP
jgi:tetratricopeptide (TPR) repeat protein